MSRWKEIGYNLGFNILFLHFVLFVVLPGGILICAPAPPDLPFLLTILAPNYAKVVLTVCLLLFGLDVASNLSISRYLRLHQTQNSPYAYEAKYEPYKSTRYFRVQVVDKVAFRGLLDDLSRDHPREAIRLWLLVENLVFAPLMLFLALFALVFVLLPWLVTFLWGRFRGRKRHPTAQN